MRTTRYNIPYKGLGTEFSEGEQPIEYASNFVNRFINLFGQAEKRQGIKKFGTQIPSFPNLNSIHEWVDKTGDSTYFVGGAGKIFRYNTSSASWDTVLSSVNASAALISVQMSDKLIFVNGIDRNFYTDDGGDTFQELQAIINIGTMGAGTSSTEMTDSTITNWSNQTFVAVNDLIYNATTSAEAIITSVGTTDLDTSPTGSAATGIGFAANANAQGNEYEIWDLVELNIIPTKTGDDNVALTTTGTGPTVVAVSGITFSQTDVRTGDYIYNTTRNAFTRITSVSANLVVVTVATQIAGDTVTFHKKAMPIATYAHVHYGRLYLVDERDQTKVRISGPDDPQDFTTYTKTLSASTIDYGSRYSKGGSIRTLSTFGRYLIAGGYGQVFVDSGQNPIVDTTGQSTDLSPVGNFTQGCVSKYGLANIGNNMLYLAFDGVRTFKSSYDSNAVDTLNVSEAIKTEIQTNIATQLGNDQELQLVHYPKRNWVLCKVGSVIYNYNYTPIYIDGQLVNNGSFTKFTGMFAEQNAYFITNNGEFITCGADGLVYKFDTGNYDDDSDTITTIMESGWLSLEEPNKTVNIKRGAYIKPVFETGENITYTIAAAADFDKSATDSSEIIVSGAGIIGRSVIGGSQIGGTTPYDPKIPLIWRGRLVKIRFETDDTKGEDIISNFTLYGQIVGRQ